MAQLVEVVDFRLELYKTEFVGASSVILERRFATKNCSIKIQLQNVSGLEF